MGKIDFEWDEKKDKANRKKHDVSFYEAQKAFLDPYRVIAEDLEHSCSERRFYCFSEFRDDVFKWSILSNIMLKT